MMNPYRLHHFIRLFLRLTSFYPCHVVWQMHVAKRGDFFPSRSVLSLKWFVYRMLFFFVSQTLPDGRWIEFYGFILVLIKSGSQSGPFHENDAYQYNVLDPNIVMQKTTILSPHIYEVLHVRLTTGSFLLAEQKPSVSNQSNELPDKV